MSGTGSHFRFTDSGLAAAIVTFFGWAGGPSSAKLAWAGCGRVSAKTIPPATASRARAVTITAPRLTIGFWLSAPSTLGRSGVPPYGSAGPCCGAAPTGSPTTVNGSRTGVPRKKGFLVFTQTIAVAVPPSGSSTTSGLIMNARASSGFVAVSVILAGELPQLLSWTTWRPRHRPAELTGTSFACRPKTLPISRSPSTTALASASSVERTRTPNGQVPPGAPVPPGGLNTTTAVASCFG